MVKKEKSITKNILIFILAVIIFAVLYNILVGESTQNISNMEIVEPYIGMICQSRLGPLHGIYEEPQIGNPLQRDCEVIYEDSPYFVRL